MNTKDTTIQVRCSQFQKDCITAFCSDYGISVSDFIMKLCMRFANGVTHDVSDRCEDDIRYQLVSGLSEPYSGSFNLIFKNILESLNM